MAKNENVGFSDRVIAVLRDKDGKVKAKFDSGEHEHKCLTNVGFALIAGLLLNDVAVDDLDFIGIGTGVVAADPTDTTLGAEEKRKAGTGTRVTTTVANDTAQIVASFSSTDTLSGVDNITEVGMFTLVAGGVMVMRQTFTAIPCDWDAGDTLEMTVRIQAKQGA